ncbi:NACHT domain-containing protein [Saccharothrix longispora]|nr:NACHT domain-containing protein [Saccharothrix longispora]
MPQGGRKHRGEAGPLPALTGFHARLAEAMGNAGIGSVNQLVPLVRPHIPRNELYEICGGRALPERADVERLARALSVSSEHLLPTWEEAKAALERETLLRMSARSSAKASWRDLPLPADSLLDILNAQHAASDTFPYRLLGVNPPPVSRIHVKPALRPAESPKRKEKEDLSARLPVPLDVALDRHEHLLIIGDPGYGKSMLGRSLVRQLSDRWLRLATAEPIGEAVVPLYVPAVQVPPTGSWSGRLAAVVRNNNYLVAEPEPTLFANRMRDVRWLIVVDGLDEIHDPDRRHELLNVLNRLMLHRGPYRLVITSRPLPRGELELLRAPDLGEYTLQPFGHDQLSEFARGWFEAQRADDAAEQADRFLDHIAESHLSEVVQVPLLATIAAAMQTTSPKRPLPATQVELYERFVDELLHARQTGSDTAWRSWLHRSRESLLSFLARLHLDGETPLLPAAQRWVDLNRPADLVPPRDPERHVEQVLVDSGLLTVSGGVFRFIHQSIVEYLAAHYHAERAGASFEGMQRWVDQAVEQATSGNLALFTLAIWSRHESHDGGMIVRRLLAIGVKAVETLVRLVTAGVVLDADLEKAVVDRLIALLHEKTHSLDPVSLIRRVGELPTLAHRLEELVASNTTKFDSRVKAATAYAWVVDESRGAEMLYELVGSADSTGRLDIFYALQALRHDGAILVDLAQSVLDDRRTDRWTRVNAAYALVECNRAEGAADLVMNLAKNSDITDSEFVHAASFVLAVRGRQCAGDIMRMMDGHRHTHVWCLDELAKALGEVGAHDELARLGRYVFEHPDADGDSDLVHSVVRAWSLSAGERGAGHEVADTIRSAPHISQDTKLWAAREMHRTGLQREAVDLIMKLAPRAKHGDHDFSFQWAFEVPLETDQEKYLPDIIRVTGDHGLVKFSKLTDVVIQGGNADTVVEAARRLLANPVEREGCRLAAVRAWLRADVTAAPAILPIVRGFQPGPEERLGYADAMSLHGATRDAHTLALDVLADPVASREHLLRAVKLFLRTGGPDEVATAIATLRANRRCTALERAWIAAELCAANESHTARNLWLDALVGPDVQLGLRVQAAEELRELGAVDQGRVAIDTAALVSGLTNAEADRLARLRRWLEEPIGAR